MQKLLSRWLGEDAMWVQRHMAGCPKCQKRFTSLGKVDVALSLIKSEPHRLDLLMRANSKTVNVLKHGVRGSDKACKLSRKLPDLTVWQRLGKYSSSAINVAACLALVVLMKVGIVSSMDKFHSTGCDVVENYYASQVGQDISDEIFTA